MVSLYHVLCDSVQNTRTKRSPSLSKFDLFVDLICNPSVTWAPKNTPSTQGPRPELHTSLAPSNGIALVKQLRCSLYNVAEFFIHRMLWM